MPESHAQKYSTFLEGLTAYMARKPAAPHQRKGRDYSALHAWRDEPSGSPITSQWAVVANDNRAEGPDVDQEEAQYSTDMVREIVIGGNNITRNGPIMASVDRAEYREVPAFAMIPRDRDAPPRRTERYPVGGDIEYGVHIDEKKRGHKVVSRIGKLRFSDGTQTELAMVRDATGKVVERQVRVPVGGLLGDRERTRQEKGGNPVWGADNTRWREWLGHPQPARAITSGPVRRGKNYSAAESRAMLAAAIANTHVMPQVTKCPPGLPHQPERVADMFLAGKKSSCSGGGAASWQDDASSLVAADAWKKVRAEMLEEDVAVLDAALTAKNYGDVGAAVGKSRKAGPRLLRAANDNLDRAIKKHAA